jgi:hypothetical protein
MGEVEAFIAATLRTPRRKAPQPAAALEIASG